MLHSPYPKIPARPDPSLTSPGGIWVATEKIHGAHLVIGCDAEGARIGKRKAWLDDGDAFFGWQLLRAELLAAARAIRDALGGPWEVRIFGELFGGAYPHEAVAPSPGLSAVQTGIWYAPDLHFSAFDILVEDAFLSYAELEQLAEAHGVHVAPLIGRGTRRVIDALPTRMLTNVPAWFGLPPIDGNVAEGLVVKADARCSPSERFVLKRKIPEFDDERFDEASAFQSHVRLDVDGLVLHATRMVNIARIASARSKVGTLPGAIREEVVLDVLVDLEAAFPNAYRSLTPEADSQLRAELDRLATAAL